VSGQVVADTSVCIGAGTCVLTAPAVFDQDDDGVVVVTDAEPGPGEADRVRDAVALCPSGALRFASG
jgi:ferredoxin